MQPTLTRLTLECYQHRLPLCRIYLHTAGKKEEKAEFENICISRYSLRRLLRLGVIPLRFCEFFVGKKNKTRILCTFSITVIILVSKTTGSEFESQRVCQNPAVGAHTRSPKPLADMEFVYS